MMNNNPNLGRYCCLTQTESCHMAWSLVYQFFIWEDICSLRQMVFKLLSITFFFAGYVPVMYKVKSERPTYGDISCVYHCRRCKFGHATNGCGPSKKAHQHCVPA